MHAAERGTATLGASTDLRTAMETDGYIVVPNVFSAREVGAMRMMVTTFCDAGTGTYYENEFKANLNVFAPEPEGMRALLAHSGLARVMKEVVGPDVFFMRELGVGLGGTSGWHKDTHGLARSVRGEHEEYGVYKVLIYPQDHLGLEPDDFALNVRRGSHWIPDPKQGEIETLYVRAGDAIVIDCRTSHRGRNSTLEGAGILRRALYSPLRRGAPGFTWEVRRRLARLMRKQERQLITMLYGKRNHFSEEYMRQGRALMRKKFPNVDVDMPLPSSWMRALEEVGVGY